MRDGEWRGGVLIASPATSTTPSSLGRRSEPVQRVVSFICSSTSKARHGASSPWVQAVADVALVWLTLTVQLLSPDDVKRQGRETGAGKR